MKQKSVENFLYSVVGVAALVVVLVAFNAIAAAFKERVDLTKEKAYTLSGGSRAILAKLDTPITIKFYYSREAGGDEGLLQFKTYAAHVEDLVDEYRQASHGKIVIQKFDPQPDSDAEDSANLDGVEGQPLSNGDKFYLGLAIHMADNTEAIAFLNPDRERLLEYDLSRAISRVANPDKPVVGVMTSLPMFGQASNPMMMQMGQRGQNPWVFVSQLKQDYTVRPVEMTADKIDDDIKVLVVVHPKDITDSAQYAIDQFIMRGGKLIAFLDGLSLTDRSGQNPMMGGMQMPGGGSSMDKLIKAWGLEFQTDKVVADMDLKMRMNGRTGPVDAPAVLSVTPAQLSKDDIATADIDDAWLPFCGAFTGKVVPGLSEAILIHSTTNSELVEGMMASLSSDSVIKDFKPSGVQYALAVKLTGKFKTAFPEGKPADKTEADKSDADKKPAAPAPGLKECKSDNVVVLFGDADMLGDDFAVSQQNIPFLGPVTQAMNGNLALAENVIEQLAGDNNLIQVRSRATMSRPFTRINEMQSKAELSYQSKIKELEDSLQQAREHINELQAQRGKSGQQRLDFSPEQQAEVDKYRKTAANVDQELKGVRKKLAADINSLENELKWGNIIAMPALVAVAGLVLAGVKRKRTSAK